MMAPGHRCPWPLRALLALGSVRAACSAESLALTVRAGPAATGELAQVRIVSPVRVSTPEALKAEIIAAEAALTLRAEVDGAAVVYDSPSVSISLRKVSPDALVEAGTQLDAADGAKVKIPADPRVRGRHGGPVTVTITSYHTGDRIKDLPTVKYGANRQVRRVVSGGEAGARQKEDRVDFFMTKTSVSWRGTVNVKVPGLGAEVPAHDRPWAPYGKEGEERYAEDRAQVRGELEALASLPREERQRGYRRLARQWHPDKHPTDKGRATDVFTYLQEMKEALLDLGR